MSNEKKSKSTRTDTIAKEKNIIRSLRQSIKTKNTEIKRLKSELATLNAAFSKTREFLKGSTEELAVEKLIDTANNKSLKHIKIETTLDKECPLCGEELKLIKAKGFTIKICTNCNYRSNKIDGENK